MNKGPMVSSAQNAVLIYAGFLVFQTDRDMAPQRCLILLLAAMVVTDPVSDWTSYSKVYMYRFGLKGLQGFEMSRYIAANGEKLAPTCLSAILEKVEEKCQNPVQAFQSNAVKWIPEIPIKGVDKTDLDGI